MTAGQASGFASDSIVIRIVSPDVPDLTLIDLYVNSAHLLPIYLCHLDPPSTPPSEAYPLHPLGVVLTPMHGVVVQAGHRAHDDQGPERVRHRRGQRPHHPIHQPGAHTSTIHQLGTHPRSVSKQENGRVLKQVKGTYAE